MRDKTNKLLRVVVTVGLLALIPALAACTKTASSTPSSTQPAAEAPAQTGAGTSADSGAATTSDATLKLLEPTDGAKVAAGTVKVRVETTGIKYTMPSTKNVAGQGHVHFTLDNGPVQMSIEPRADLKNVAPGVHKLKAELVQNDTQPFNPPVEEVIEFTAK